MKRTALFCISFLLVQPGWAQDCAGPALFDAPRPPASGPTQAWANRLDASRTQWHLDGNVTLTGPNLWLRTPALSWDRTGDTLQVTGPFQVRSSQWLISGTQAEYDRAQRRLRAEQARFQQADRRLRGRAERIEQDDSRHQTRLQDAVLTTCPLGRDDWFLHAKKVRVDRENQRVYAHHAWLDFKGVPLLYTPYISYPLSERASGFLMPSFQSYQSPNRTTSSWLVGVPYYFNLAPNYDDTLTLYQFQDRGTLVDNEFRSLNTWQRSTLTASWLDDQITGTSRWRVKLDGTQRFGAGLSGRIHWQQVSDKDFFADIPLEPALTTRSFERRELRLDWRPNDRLSAFIRHQDYLLLRNHGTYYELRPQMGLTLRAQPTPLTETKLYTELTQFDIPIDHSRPEGLRTLVRPTLTFRRSAAWGEVGATLQLQHNRYDLLQGAGKVEFTVPMTEVHGTLVFERSADEWGAGWSQTLEPKLQFAWIPHVDQQAAPNFDSGLRSLNFSNLFALNRFSGADRVGDTRRISTALTTRLFDTRGHERMRAAIGQAFWLDVRRVGLTGSIEDSTPRSNLFGQLRIDTGTLLLDNTLELAEGSLELVNLISRLRWRSDWLTLTSQYSWQQINQPSEKQLLLTGAQWRPGGPWRLGAYVHYDYIADQRVETAWSVGYERCCWMGELQLDETRLEDGRYNYSFRLVFTLKGLSTTGRSFDRLLRNKLNF